MVTKGSFRIDSITKKLANIAADYSITIAYLFVSYLDETFNEHSDIDIALVFKEPPSEIPLLKIEMNLTNLLDRKCSILLTSAPLITPPCMSKGKSSQMENFSTPLMRNSASNSKHI